MHGIKNIVCRRAPSCEVSLFRETLHQTIGCLNVDLQQADDIRPSHVRTFRSNPQNQFFMPQGSDIGLAPVLNRLILRLVDRSSETVFLSLAGADGFDKSSL